MRNSLTQQKQMNSKTLEYKWKTPQNDPGTDRLYMRDRPHTNGDPNQETEMDMTLTDRPNTTKTRNDAEETILKTIEDPEETIPKTNDDLDAQTEKETLHNDNNQSIPDNYSKTGETETKTETEDAENDIKKRRKSARDKKRINYAEVQKGKQTKPPKLEPNNPNQTNPPKAEGKTTQNGQPMHRVQKADENHLHDDQRITTQPIEMR